MAKLTFVNLPISDVDRSREFFTELGFSFNEQFSDDKALCMVISETSYAMLLKSEFFATFLDKPVGDPKTSVTALVSITFDTKDEVLGHCEKAFALGARKYKEPTDFGFLYQQSYEDLDGNIWVAIWMDPAAVQA